ADAKELARCSDETLAAYQPFVKGNNLYYIAEVAQGRELKAIPLKCQQLPLTFLLDYNYLSENTLADTPVVIRENLKTEHKSEEFAEYTHRLRPHSWTFFSGRGWFLSQETTNYLNSFGYSFGIGEDSEERQPFGNITLFYNKFYPVFSLSYNYDKRKDSANVTWDEQEAIFKMAIPYQFEKGLYNFYWKIAVNFGFLQYSLRRKALPYALSDDQLVITGGEISLKYTKDR